jgi:hypothetical protein
MKTKHFYGAVASLLLLATTFLSCQKNPSTDTGVTAPPVIGTPILPATPVQALVSGIVTDENDAPVPNATVVIAGSNFNTDSKGFFSTNTLTLDKYISTVTVNKTGYFTAIRSFPANSGRNYVAIKLIPKTQVGSFSSATGGSVSLPNGSQINFVAAGIVSKTSGAPYTGNVRVFSAYIDPTASDILARMPGSLIGQDASNMYALTSAGMLAVELESDAGVPLQLATGKAAAVKLLIPASLQGTAPATMDTWSLDARGVWKKEGNATKNGNYYEFTASHFSYWNCDIPNSSIYLTLHVTNQNNQPLANTLVDIIPTMPGMIGHCGGLTDSAGNATAFVPANQVLQLSVKAYYACTTLLYTQNIGPYTANANVNIVSTINSLTQVTVQGTALNCSGAPVQSGTALIYSSNYNLHHVPIVNGSFSRTIYYCSPIATIGVVAIDNAAQQQSNTVNVAVTGNTANAGTLNACGTVTGEFVNYTVDGTPYTINPATAGNYLYTFVTPGFSTNIVGGNQSGIPNYGSLSFVTPGTAIGTFTVRNDSLSINNYSGAVRQPSASVTFTAYGTTGQFIEGSFNIPFTHNSTGATIHSCTGSFRFRRL